MKKTIIMIGVLGLVFVCGLICFVNNVNSDTSDCFCYEAPEYSDVPVGQIFMWYDVPENLSFGWYVCNSTNHVWNNTVPNLQSMFLVGYNSSDADYNAIGKLGGEKTHILTIAELAAHTHTYNTYANIGTYMSTTGIKTFGVVSAKTGNTPAGTAAAHENRPPYKTLYYVMYLGV